MPKLNKIRVSNISLDYGNKLVGDKTFRLYGESSLFLLENGGGKSSIIQFIHQLVLPNHEMSGRKMTKMVPVGNTIHIAAEWLPDDEHRSPVIIGFCYQNTGKKSNPSDKGYRYFNYIIECEYDKAYQIEDLPFIIDKKPANFEQFRDKLRKSIGVSISTSIAKYQEELESFGILSSEWEDMSLVNGSEGGVTDFFEKTNTTQRLLEKLLIPSVISSLYPNEEERNSIKDWFKKNKDSLMELPELEKNLRDFQVVTQSSDDFINICKTHNELKQKLFEIQTLLSRLYITLLENSKGNKEALEQITSDLSVIDELKRELNWKIQSFGVFHLNQELVVLKENNEKDKETVQTLSVEVNQLERRKKEQLAARCYEDYIRYQTNWTRANAELEAFKMEKGERQEEFFCLGSDLSKQFSYLLHQNEQLRLEAKKSHQTALDEVEQVKQEKKSLEEEKNTKERQRAKCKEKINMYQSELLKLKTGMMKDWKIDEIDTLSHLNAKLKEAQENEKELKERTNYLSGAIYDLQLNMVQNETAREKKENQKQEKDNAFEIFSDKELKLIDETYSLLTIQVKNLFEEKDGILLKISRTKQQYENEITKKSIEIDHIEKIQKAIEKNGYHAHVELENVRDYLIEKDVNVVLGAEWMTKVQLDEQVKRTLLTKNPLLPVSILIEEAQMDRAKRILGNYKHELSIPIVFINKTTMDNQNEKDGLYQVDDSLHIFHHFHVRLQLEDWQQYLTQLEERLEHLETEKAEIQLKSKELQQFQSAIEQFWKDYFFNSRIQFTNELNQLKEQCKNLDFEKTQLETNIQKYRTELEQTKTNALEKERKRTQLSEQTRDLSNFLQRYADIKTIKEQMEEVKGSIQALLDQITQTECKLNNYEEITEKQNERYHYFDKKIGILENNVKNYELQETEETIETTEMEFHESFEKYKVLRANYEGDATSMKSLLTTLENCRLQVKRAISGIEENGFSLEAMEKLHVEFDQRLFEQMQFDLSEFNEQLAMSKDSLNQSNIALAVMKEKCNSETERLKKTYDLGVYDYGVDPENEKKLFQNQVEEIVSEELDKTNQKNLLFNQQSKNQSAIDHLDNLKDTLILSSSLKALEDGEWNKKKPSDQVWRLTKEIEQKKEEIAKKNDELKKRHRLLNEEVKATKNASLIQMTFEFSKILENSKDNHEEIIKTFIRLLDAIQIYEGTINARKSELDRQSGELVEQMFGRCETVYKNIIEIAKSSQIENKGEIVNLIKINWPKKDINESKHHLQRFINDILDEMVKMNDENAKPEEMDAVFEKMFNVIDIMNGYAETSRCEIKVLKHRNELINKYEHYEWGEVCVWSGGEKHATQISMFISLINHLRKKRFAKENAWKFIILDNPFGKASSEHVVKPMIELAKKNKTQLFCFTNIKEKSIQREFNTVFSNQFVEQRGKVFLSTEESHKKDSFAAELDSIFVSKQK